MATSGLTASKVGGRLLAQGEVSQEEAPARTRYGGPAREATGAGPKEFGPALRESQTCKAPEANEQARGQADISRTRAAQK